MSRWMYRQIDGQAWIYRNSLVGVQKIYCIEIKISTTLKKSVTGEGEVISIEESYRGIRDSIINFKGSNQYIVFTTYSVPMNCRFLS